MEVLDLVDALRLDDGDAVEEVFALDQYAFEIHGVVRRDPQIALWHIVGQGAGLDANWQHVLSAHDVTAAIAALADPFDRARDACAGHDFVADLELLDALVSARRADRGAAAITGRGGVVGYLIDARGFGQHEMLLAKDAVQRHALEDNIAGVLDLQRSGGAVLGPHDMVPGVARAGDVDDVAGRRRVAFAGETRNRGGEIAGEGRAGALAGEVERAAVGARDGGEVDRPGSDRRTAVQPQRAAVDDRR